MCFTNLPLEFDEAGDVALRSGVTDPFSLTTSRPEVGQTEQQRQEAIRRLMARNGHVKDVSIDPVTRVAGALALQMTADLENRRYVDAHSEAPLFRGYEVILMGRDPRDAVFVASRACGVCGGVHAHCAAYALEMAMGIEVPPMGTVVRNLGEAAEMGYDNPLHLYLLAGPDYCEQTVKTSEPALWQKAQNWSCPNRRHHGFATMAELMTELNPLTGKLYREGLEFTRLAREKFSLLHGKFPHPQTIVPGGVSSTVTIETINEYQSRQARIFDYALRMIGVWDDIADFYYEADERYKQVGARPMSMLDNGFWDDPFAYDATYENCNDWGEARWSTPGIVVDGNLVSTRLTDINVGFEEFVEHSYYEQWTGAHFDTDPAGAPISPFHPWNKQTLPKPTEKSWKDRYTWDTAPRWDRRVMEAGAYARMVISAKAQRIPTSELIQATGDSIRMHIPKGIDRKEEVVEWRVPQVWNAFERNRARAYHYLYSQLVGLESVFQAYRLYRDGERSVASLTHKELEKVVQKAEGRGVGFWGAGRGWLNHWAVLENGKISNYQIVTPSTVNASPRDPWDQPGPYEEAIMNTPILEEYNDTERFTSVDMLRAIRSFDPCMPCTTHVHTGTDTVVREVNTCACGAD